jgi:hypothetical protein
VQTSRYLPVVHGTTDGAQHGAAHLVDRVLPSAPYRQWVLSVPKPLRLRLAPDPAWTSWVGGLIIGAVGAWQRRVARARGIGAPLTGAITFVQRFGGLVN